MSGLSEPSRAAGARMLRGALAGLALSGAYAFVCWLLVAASGGM